MTLYPRLVVALISLLVATTGQAECSRNLTLAYSTDYVPYQYTDPLGRPAGLDIDIAEMIVKRMGCQLSLINYPPKRAQKLLAEGVLDIMPAASITEQRQQFAHFSAPYRQEQIVMFAHRNQIKTIKHLSLNQAIDRGLTITAGLGGWYGDQWTEAETRANDAGLLVLTNSTKGRIRMLLTHRIDLVIADRYVGYFHSTALGQRDQIAELSHHLNDDPVHFMLSRKTFSEQEHNAFNQALAWVLASDGYQKLINDYRPAQPQ